MAPLKGVNRAFARSGTEDHVPRGETPGTESAGRCRRHRRDRFSVYHATFMLGPRLECGWADRRPLAGCETARGLMTEPRRSPSPNGFTRSTMQRKAVESGLIFEDATQTAQVQRTLEADPGLNAICRCGIRRGLAPGRDWDRSGPPQRQVPSCRPWCIGWGEGLGPVAKGSARSVRRASISATQLRTAAREGIVIVRRRARHGWRA